MSKPAQFQEAEGHYIASHSDDRSPAGQAIKGASTAAVHVARAIRG